jgi:phosphoglucomutase
MHELAGKPAPREDLVNVPRLVTAYYTLAPDPDNPLERVAFGTSGHRGSSLSRTFNEAHVAAIARAVAEDRRDRGVTGPLYLGMDTHALSEPAFATTLEVLAAEGVEVRIQSGRGYTPTPVVSWAILNWNREHSHVPADGILLTPSHNPPGDGGFKYNPPSGGPADPATTKRIEARANELLATGLNGVKRFPYERALGSSNVREEDWVRPYARDLGSILDLKSVAASGLRIGADPLGGAGIAFWGVIAEEYGLNIDLVNPAVDPTFGFMTLDWDGKIRMDCSSPWAMAGLIRLKDRYDIAFGNDPDADRHGIVTPSRGLLPPNAYLAVAIDRLFRTRSRWRPDAGIGKTLVSSALIDRVAEDLGIPLRETPVGFKWFVEGLLSGDLGFGGEESAGASFLRFDGTAWSTDKDGIIMNLLAAETTAVAKADPGVLYGRIVERLGEPCYARIDVPAGKAEKKVLGALTPEELKIDALAGDPVIAVLDRAPFGGDGGTSAPIGGIKVKARNSWFAARPSGTEDVYKIYAESFLGSDHLAKVQETAKEAVAAAFRRAGTK